MAEILMGHIGQRVDGKHARMDDCDGGPLSQQDIYTNDIHPQYYTTPQEVCRQYYGGNKDDYRVEDCTNNQPFENYFIRKCYTEEFVDICEEYECGIVEFFDPQYFDGLDVLAGNTFVKTWFHNTDDGTQDADAPYRDDFAARDYYPSYPAIQSVIHPSLGFWIGSLLRVKAGANYIFGIPDDIDTVEFCHPALGCSNFGMGEGIILKGNYDDANNVISIPPASDTLPYIDPYPDDSPSEGTDIPFCDAYDCFYQEFWSIDKFSVEPGGIYARTHDDSEIGDGINDDGQDFAVQTATYYMGYGWWQGTTSEMEFNLSAEYNHAGYQRITLSNQQNLELLEFCHPAPMGYDYSTTTTVLFSGVSNGCIGFGTGTGIYIPPASADYNEYNASNLIVNFYLPETVVVGDAIIGCMDETACNYNAEAVSDDGSCTYPQSECYDCDENYICGCTDVSACNYDSQSLVDNGTCEYPEYQCWDNSLACTEQDCPATVIIGQIQVNGPGTEARHADGTECNNGQSDGGGWEGEEGSTDEAADLGLTVPLNPTEVCYAYFTDCGTYADCVAVEDEECNFVNNQGDLIWVGYQCVGDPYDIITGCTDDTACNYNEAANTDDGSCYYPTEINCYYDADGDGYYEAMITTSGCDPSCPDGYVEGNPEDWEAEVHGCMDYTACNYNSDANNDDGSCYFPPGLTDCFDDTDGDGDHETRVEINLGCGEECSDYSGIGGPYNDTYGESSGCTDVYACNYDDTAEVDNGSCFFETTVWCYLDSDGDGYWEDEFSITECEPQCPDGYIESSTQNYGDGPEVFGCTDEEACNYDEDASQENGSCVYPPGPYCDCDGNIDEGYCDCYGATNSTVCGSIYKDCFNNCECFNDADSDGICDEDDACVGENDECGVCNGTGIPEGNCDCDGNVLDDCGICGGDGPNYQCWDNSLVCLEHQCPPRYGCTDSGLHPDYDRLHACNYDPEAEVDDGSCLYDVDVCGTPLKNCNQSTDPADCTCYNDIDNDGICDEIDNCVGQIDECGNCCLDGTIQEGCPNCTDTGIPCGIPEGDCDCNGNVLDECQICGGQGPQYECWPGGPIECNAQNCPAAPAQCNEPFSCNFGAYQECEWPIECNTGINFGNEYCVSNGEFEYYCQPDFADDVACQNFNCMDNGFCSYETCGYVSPFPGVAACNYDPNACAQLPGSCTYPGDPSDMEFPDIDDFIGDSFFGGSIFCNGVWRCDETDCLCPDGYVNIFGECYNIQTTDTLVLNNLQLEGTIPLEVFELVNLETLKLNNNNFTEGIPGEIGNLTSLRTLEITYNELYGSLSTSFPAEFENLVNLETLNLSHNQFLGTSDGFGQGFAGLIENNVDNLKTIKLQNCGIDADFGSVLDASLGIAAQQGSEIRTFILKDNRLSGNIPENIFRLPNLKTLDLSNNYLTGEIPFSIGNMTDEINLIDLRGNSLNGVIPEVICNLYDSGIINLYLSNNDICPTYFENNYPECLTEETIGNQDTSSCEMIPEPSFTATQVIMGWKEDVGQNTNCRGPFPSCDGYWGGNYADIDTQQECCSHLMLQQFGIEMAPDTFTEIVECGEANGWPSFQCRVPFEDLVYTCEKRIELPKYEASNIAEAISRGITYLTDDISIDTGPCTGDHGLMGDAWNMAVCCPAGHQLSSIGECKNNENLHLVPLSNPVTGEVYILNGIDACNNQPIPMFEDYNFIPNFCHLHDCCVNCNLCPDGDYLSGYHLFNRECTDGGFLNWSYFTDPIKAMSSDIYLELYSIGSDIISEQNSLFYFGYSAPGSGAGINHTTCDPDDSRWCNEADDPDFLFQKWGLSAGQSVNYISTQWVLRYVESSVSKDLPSEQDTLTFSHPGLPEPIILQRNQDVYFTIPEVPGETFSHTPGCMDDGFKNQQWWEGIGNNFNFDYSEFYGIDYPGYRACNYNPNATVEDGSCEYNSCIGCPDYGPVGIGEHIGEISCTCWTPSPECEHICCLPMTGTLCEFDWINPLNHTCPDGEACIPASAAGGVDGEDSDVCQPKACGDPSVGFFNPLSFTDIDSIDDSEAVPHVWGCVSSDIAPIEDKYACCKYFSTGYNPIILPLQLNQWNDVNYEFQSNNNFWNTNNGLGVDITQTNVRRVTKGGQDYMKRPDDGLIPGGLSYVSLYPWASNMQNIGDDVNFFDGIGLLGGGVGKDYDWINSGHACANWDADGICSGNNNSKVGHGSYKFFNQIYSFLTASPNQDSAPDMNFLSDDPGWLGRKNYYQDFTINPHTERSKHIAPFIDLNDETLEEIEVDGVEPTYFTIRAQIHPNAMIESDFGEAHLNSYWLSNVTDNLGFPISNDNRLVLGKGSENLIVNVTVDNGFIVEPVNIGPMQCPAPSCEKLGNTNTFNFGYEDDGNTRWELDVVNDDGIDDSEIYLQFGCGNAPSAYDNQHITDGGEFYSYCSPAPQVFTDPGANIWGMPRPQASDFGTEDEIFSQFSWSLYQSWLYEFTGWWCHSLRAEPIEIEGEVYNEGGYCEWKGLQKSGGSFEGGLAAFIRNCKNPSHNPADIFGDNFDKNGPEGTTQLDFCPIYSGNNTNIAKFVPPGTPPACDSNVNYCFSEKIHETVWKIIPDGYNPISTRLNIQVTDISSPDQATTYQSVNIFRYGRFGTPYMTVTADEVYNYLVIPPQDVLHINPTTNSSTEANYDFGYAPFTGKNKSWFDNQPEGRKVISKPYTEAGHFLESSFPVTDYSGYYAKIPFSIRGDAFGAVFGNSRPEIDVNLGDTINQVGGGIYSEAHGERYLFCHEYLTNNSGWTFDKPCIEFITGEWADDKDWGVPIGSTSAHKYKPALVNLELKEYTIDYSLDGVCEVSKILCNPQHENQTEVDAAIDEAGEFYEYCPGQCMPDETEYFYDAYIFPEKQYDKIFNSDGSRVHSEIPYGYGANEGVVKYNLSLIVYDGNGPDSYDRITNESLKFLISKSSEGDKKYQFNRYDGDQYTTPFSDKLGCLSPHGSDYLYDATFPIECTNLDSLQLQDDFKLYWTHDILSEWYNNRLFFDRIEWTETPPLDVTVTLPWRNINDDGTIFNGGTCYDEQGNIAVDAFGNQLDTIERCFCLNPTENMLDQITENGDPIWQGSCDDSTSPICSSVDGISPHCLYLQAETEAALGSFYTISSFEGEQFDYERNLTCDTLINQDLSPLNSIRAVCSGGGEDPFVVMGASSADNGVISYPGDFSYYDGNTACKSQYSICENGSSSMNGGANNYKWVWKRFDEQIDFTSVYLDVEVDITANCSSFEHGIDSEQVVFGLNTLNKRHSIVSQLPEQYNYYSEALDRGLQYHGLIRSNEMYDGISIDNQLYDLDAGPRWGIRLRNDNETEHPQFSNPYKFKIPFRVLDKNLITEFYIHFLNGDNSCSEYVNMQLSTAGHDSYNSPGDCSITCPDNQNKITIHSIKLSLPGISQTVDLIADNVGGGSLDVFPPEQEFPEMNVTGYAKFIIDYGVWEQFGFDFSKVGEPKIKMSTDNPPAYAMLNNEFLEEDLPDWYSNGMVLEDFEYIRYNNETVRDFDSTYINHKISTQLWMNSDLNGLNNLLENPWEWLCIPFNEIWNDEFSLALELDNYYKYYDMVDLDIKTDTYSYSTDTNIGPELTTNGNFTQDPNKDNITSSDLTGWNIANPAHDLGNSISLQNNQLFFQIDYLIGDHTQDNIFIYSESGIFEVGKQYKVVVDVAAINGNNPVFEQMGGGGNIVSITEPGITEFTFEAIDNGGGAIDAAVLRRGGTLGSFTLNSISIKEHIPGSLTEADSLYEFETDCNIFETNPDIFTEAYQPIVLEVGELTKTFDFDILVGKECEVAVDTGNQDTAVTTEMTCLTEEVVDQLFQDTDPEGYFYSPWIIDPESNLYQDIVPSQAEISFSFDWLYEDLYELNEGEGEQCLITIILEDAEYASDSSGQLAFLQFSNDGGATYQDIGKLSSGLHKTVWENQPGEEIQFPGNWPGVIESAGDPSGIHWAFTTGFAGSINSDGVPDPSTGFLLKTYCKTGVNTIKLIGGDDWFKLKYVKVEKIYNTGCAPGFRCGVTQVDFKSPYNIRDVFKGWGSIKENNTDEKNCQLFGHCSTYGVCETLDLGETFHCNGGIKHGRECTPPPDGNHMDDECRSTTLSRNGLISYDYKMSINLEDSVGISAPMERFENLRVSTRGNNPNDLKDFIERYCETFDEFGNCLQYNETKKVSIVGYRNGTNCCNPNDDINCFEREQTNFYLEAEADSTIRQECIAENDIGQCIEYSTPFITLSGNIINSPYRFCSITEFPYLFEDKIMMDSGAGYGSPIYDTLYISNEAQTPGYCVGYEFTGEIWDGPKVLEQYNNQTFCELSYAGGEGRVNQWVIDYQYPNYDIYLDTQPIYEPISTKYDSWSNQIKPEFTVLSVEEGFKPQLQVKLQRHFHDLFGLNPGNCVGGDFGNINLDEWDNNPIGCENAGGEFIPSESFTNIGPIDIILQGVNPPHIHYLKYDSESKTQIGIQNSELVVYDNVGADLTSNEYLNANSDPNFGVRAIGNIDFSTYEPHIVAGGDESQYQAILLLNTFNGQELELSNVFTIHTEYDNFGNASYIWDNIIEAVNDSPTPFKAYLATYSDPNPDTNIKTVIIEANDTGEQYNGTLSWTLNPEKVVSPPTFSPLLRGETYPIIHVYEDFGYFDLHIAASDFDRLSTLSLNISSTETENIEVLISQESAYMNSQGIPWQDGYNFFTDGYVYPYEDYIPDLDNKYTELSQLDHNGFVCNMEFEPACLYPQSLFAHYNGIIRVKQLTENWNGVADIILRVIDKDSSYDKVAFKLVVHPVNDAPQLEAIGDRNIFINNEKFPNETNIKIEYSDIEENKDSLVLDNISLVNGDYCFKVEKANEFINSYNVPAFIDGIQVLPDEILVDLYGEELFKNVDHQLLADGTPVDEGDPGNLNFQTWLDEEGGGAEVDWYWETDDGNYVRAVVNKNSTHFWQVRHRQDPSELRCPEYDVNGNCIANDYDYPPGTIVRLSGYLRASESLPVYMGIRGWKNHGFNPSDTLAKKDISTDWQYFEDLIEIPDYSKSGGVTCNHGGWIRCHSGGNTGDATCGSLSEGDACTMGNGDAGVCKTGWCDNQVNRKCEAENGEWDESCVINPYAMVAEFGKSRMLFNWVCPNNNAEYDNQTTCDSECQNEFQTDCVYISGSEGGDSYEVHMKDFTLARKITENTLGMDDDIFTNISCGHSSIFCRTLCYYSFGMSKDATEELCSFADYDNNGIIDDDDIIQCEEDITIDNLLSSSQLVTEFRGGLPGKCNSFKSLIDLLYEMFAYYGAQVYESGHPYGSSCNNEYTTFVDSNGDPLSNIFNSEGCIRKSACEQFFLQKYFNVCAPIPDDGSASEDMCSQYNNSVADCNNQAGCYHMSKDFDGIPGPCTLMDSNDNSTLGYGDLNDLIDGTITNNEYYFCNGGGRNTSWCGNIDDNILNDSYCIPNQAPNFLNISDEANFFSDTGFYNYKDYVFIQPEKDVIGNFYTRVGIKDSGVNEDYTATQKRTGFSKFKVTIDGGNVDGPVGNTTKESLNTFGLSADKFILGIRGSDTREQFPTSLNRNFNMTVFQYHYSTTPTDRVLEVCDSSNGGFENVDGECCAQQGITDHNYVSYFNHDNDKGGTNPVYYEDEYQSEVNLFLEYFSGKRSIWCHAEVENMQWEYSDSSQITNSNFGGFLAPNSLFNELDYTVSYKIEIIDVVENYDEIDQQSSRDWWSAVSNTNDWVEKWNMLRAEGWEDLWGAREEGHPLGDTSIDSNNDGIPDGLLITENFVSQEVGNTQGDMQSFIDNGIELDITYPSIYEFRITAKDSYGIESVTSDYIDTRDMVKLNQTLLGKYSPWQGFNIVIPPDQESINLESYFESQDKDKRPSLGLWYYENLGGNIANKQNLNWSERHNTPGGHAYKNSELAGNFISSAPIEDIENENEIYDWFPDADIRSTISLGSSNSVLYKYYDEELQPLSYEETMAPLTAQVFFYPRKPSSGNLITQGQHQLERFRAYDPDGFTGISITGYEVKKMAGQDWLIIYTDQDSNGWSNTTTDIRIPVPGDEMKLNFFDQDSNNWWLEQGGTHIVHSVQTIPQGGNYRYRIQVFAPESSVDTNGTIDCTNNIHDCVNSTFDVIGPSHRPGFYGVTTINGESKGYIQLPTLIGDGHNNEYLYADTWPIEPGFYYTQRVLFKATGGSEPGNMQFSMFTTGCPEGGDSGHHYVDIDEWNDMGNGWWEIYATWKNNTNCTRMRAVDLRCSGGCNGNASAYYFAEPMLVRGENPRKSIDNALSNKRFESTELQGITLPINKLLLSEERLYIGFLDWGDGSPIEYDRRPAKLTPTGILKHTYEHSGIYEIKGEMFKVKLSDEGHSTGIMDYREFVFRINVSRNEIENEFRVLGGEGYTFIPYSYDSPIIGGLSDYSLYKRQLKSINGIITDEIVIDTPYKYLGDKLQSEIALATSNENWKLPFMSAFTGSFASEISDFINEDDEIIIGLEDDACEYRIDLGDGDDSGYMCTDQKSDEFGREFIFDNYGVPESDKHRVAFLDCEDECVSTVLANEDRGFFEGMVDDETGQLLPEDPNDPESYKPKLINKGLKNLYGSLGDYLGDSDISQLRYLNRPVQMWEMLGFKCDEIGQTDTIQMEADYGVNYHHHSDKFIPNTTEVMAPDGTYSAGKIEIEDNTDNNPLRFGYRFRVDKQNSNILDEDIWEWEQLTQGTSGGFFTPHLIAGETYTFSTHIYIPSTNLVVNENAKFTWRFSQTCYNPISRDGHDNPNSSGNDWATSLRAHDWECLNDGYRNLNQENCNDYCQDNYSQNCNYANNWNSIHGLAEGNHNEFAYNAYNHCNHCHPKDSVDKMEWDHGRPYPMIPIEDAEAADIQNQTIAQWHNHDEDTADNNTTVIDHGGGQATLQVNGSAGNSRNDIQWYSVTGTNGLHITDGMPYTVKFEIMATANRDVKVVLNERVDWNEDGWQHTNLGLEEIIPITTEFVEHTFTFNASNVCPRSDGINCDEGKETNEGGASFVLFLGNESDNGAFDNIDVTVRNVEIKTAIGGNTLINGKSCWTAKNESECNGTCFWLDQEQEDTLGYIFEEIPQDQMEYDKWIRYSQTFTPDDYSERVSIRFDTMFGAGTVPSTDGVYVWGAQLELGDTMSSYTEQDVDPGNCANAYSGNPDHERYWKNIIPEEFPLTSRLGIASLPILPNYGAGDAGVQFSEIVFAWGNINRERILLNNGNEYETVEIYYSISPGEQITKIEIEFNGLKLPELYSDSSQTMGGIVTTGTDMSADSGESFVVSTVGENTLILNHPGCDTIQDQLGCQSLDPNDPVENRLLLKVPFSAREDNSLISFESITIYKYGDDSNPYVLVPRTDLWIYQEFGNPYPWVSAEYTSIGTIYVDEDSPQNWIDGNNNTYYYPVLPKLTRTGKFDEQDNDGEWTYGLGLQNNNIPFGSPGRLWDEDDMYSLITTKTVSDTWTDYTLIDLNFDKIRGNTIEDVGPSNNFGMLIDDYGISYTLPEVTFNKKKPKIRTKIGKKEQGKAY